MFAIVGLGNPGRRYVGSRHNIGFDVVDYLVENAETIGREFAASEKSVASSTSGGFSGQGWQDKFGCQYRKLAVAGNNYLLVKPQMYMNCSGEAAQPLLGYFKIPTDRVVVVHDELDFPPGVIRIKLGGSAAGHRGIGDLTRRLGSGKFYRVRVGIGRPMVGDGSRLEASKVEQLAGSEPRAAGDVSSWVLGKPGPGDKELLDKAVREAAGAVVVLSSQGLNAAQQRFHAAQ